MKRTIVPLVLALLLLSAPLASAKEFSDAGQIAHTEAVQILSELGIVKGKGGNTFDPIGYVTRAEMAKMIAYICQGGMVSKEVEETGLTDIRGHWAEAHISYCYTQGILSGRGGGLFAPDDNVTAAEAAKMLLTALGYRGDYTGPAWALTVIRDAQLAHIFDDVDVTSDEPVDRENAAQMIYNALLAENAAEDTGLSLLEKNFGLQSWVGPYAGGLLPEDITFADRQEIRVIYKDGEDGTAGQLDPSDTVTAPIPTAHEQFPADARAPGAGVRLIFIVTPPPPKPPYPQPFPAFL